MTANLKNPFTPGTGAMPRYLVGRESPLREVMAVAEPLCRKPGNERVSSQRAPNRDVILCGPEGVGKTVLLQRVEDELRKEFHRRDITDATILRWTPATELHDRESATNAILPTGLWDSVLKWLRKTKTVSLFGIRFDFFDGPPTTIHSALAASLSRGPLVILLDEAQGIRPAIAKELLSAGQLLRTRGAPLLLVLAGTTKLVSTLSKIDADFWKRSAFTPIGLLDRQSSEEALTKPLPKSVAMAPRAMSVLLKTAGGHPHRLQEVGAFVIRELNTQEAGKRRITESLAKKVQRNLKQIDELRGNVIGTALDEDDMPEKQRQTQLANLNRRLESEKDKLDERVAQLGLEARALAVEIGKLEAENGRLDGEVGRMKAENSRLAKQEVACAGQVASLESEKSRLDGRVVQLEASMHKISAKVAKLGAENGRLEGEVGRMKEENGRLAKLGKECADQVARVESERNRLEVTVAELSDKVKELGARNRWLRGEVGRMEEERNKVAKLGSEQTQHIAMLESKNTMLEGLYKQVESGSRQLQERCRKLEAEKGRLQEQYEQAQTESRDLSNFYRKKREQRPTRWRWLVGDDQPPADSVS